MRNMKLVANELNAAIMSFMPLKINCNVCLRITLGRTNASANDFDCDFSIENQNRLRSSFLISIQSGVVCVHLETVTHWHGFAVKRIENPSRWKFDWNCTHVSRLSVTLHIVFITAFCYGRPSREETSNFILNKAIRTEQSYWCPKRMTHKEEIS